MNKQLIKIIKRVDGDSRSSAPTKKRPKKKPSVETTIQNWITERRENVASEDLSRRSAFNSWNVEPAEVV